MLFAYVRLIDFFRYFSRDFSYNTGVASIRAGLLNKESKGWQNDVSLSHPVTKSLFLISVHAHIVVQWAV
jgi:hypothetical protein